MAKTETQKRRDDIALRIEQSGSVTVDELARRYHVSEVSIRKDLSELETQGFCVRRYGGAIASTRSVALRQDHSLRSVIAARAAPLIQPDTRIVIDSGRTTGYLLSHLMSIKGLKVMTNSLHTALKLTEMQNELTVLMPGGTWDRQTDSFQGQLAEQVLRSYDFDQLFIGADGIDLERGTTTFNELMNLSRVMAEVSKEVIVLAESSKLGRKMPNKELGWELVDTLVTDTALTQSQRQAIEQLGVTVILAELEN